MLLTILLDLFDTQIISSFVTHSLLYIDFNSQKQNWYDIMHVEIQERFFSSFKLVFSLWSPYKLADWNILWKKASFSFFSFFSKLFMNCKFTQNLHSHFINLHLLHILSRYSFFEVMSRYFLKLSRLSKGIFVKLLTVLGFLLLCNLFYPNQPPLPHIGTHLLTWLQSNWFWFWCISLTHIHIHTPNYVYIEYICCKSLMI